MLTYNTQLKQLILPEYGRNIHKMIDYCRHLPERDDRNLCAERIIQAMNTLVPPTGDPKAYNKKLWDHLAIMSEFDLDIDWPVEVVQADSLHTEPEHLGLPGKKIDRPQYGHVIEMMVAHASEMPEGEERDVLALLVANHMKKLQTALNGENVPDAKIFKDLRLMSHGVLSFDPEEKQLYEFNIIAPPKKKKKK